MTQLRHDWTKSEVAQLFAKPFMDLIFQAQQVHRQQFDPNAVQMCTLLSIKTGTCPEDCKYCSQSGHYKTEVERQKMLAVDDVVAQAKAAKANGASRFCMAGAWRSPPAKDMPALIDMIKQIKALGMETCVSGGMLDAAQAQSFKAAGLDYYNHNLDSSPEYYKKVVTTRSYDDRKATLAECRKAGPKVCCGGILGLGETRADRVSFLVELANLPQHPKSVPINRLVPIDGTPFADNSKIDALEFVRTIAVARIMMPESMLRLSAGRLSMTPEQQTLCFMAGANSIFYGEKLLTTANPDVDHDKALFAKLGIVSKPDSECKGNVAATAPAALD